jgi:predicted nuclease of predicted toxin-antitoxin system
MILTSNLDFGDLLAASREVLPSVIIFRLQNMRPENIQKHLEILLDQYREELERGAIFSINERRIRVHILPV